MQRGQTDRSARRVPSPWAAVRHHPVLVVLVVALALGAAGLLSMTGSKTYTATAVVMLSPLEGSPLSTDSVGGSSNLMTVAMETEAQMVETPAVAANVTEVVGRTLPQEGDRVKVEVPPGTQMLRISYTTDSPQLAREAAQAYAEGVLAQREEVAVDAVQKRLGLLEAQSESADQDLRQATADARGASNPAYAAQQVQVHASRLAQIDAAIADVRALSTVPGRVLNPAELPTAPAGTSPVLLLGGAGVVGLGLALLLALYREWSQDLVRDRDTHEVAGIPVLAHAAADRPDREGGDGGEDRPVLDEAFRRLRAGIVANTERPHVLAVTSVGDPHGAVVSANLATVLAQADFSVLVVAADPSVRDVETHFAVPHAPGLSDAVLDRRDPRTVLVDVDGVSVLPGGRDPQDARELYGGPGLARVVRAVAHAYDYVIVDGAGAGTADGDAAVSVADSVLVVMTADRTTRGQVAEALDRLDQLGVRVVGGVTVRPAASAHRRQASDRAAGREARRAEDSDAVPA